MPSFALEGGPLGHFKKDCPSGETRTKEIGNAVSPRLLQWELRGKTQVFTYRQVEISIDPVPGAVPYSVTMGSSSSIVSREQRRASEDNIGVVMKEELLQNFPSVNFGFPRMESEHDDKRWLELLSDSIAILSSPRDGIVVAVALRGKRTRTTQNIKSEDVGGVGNLCYGDLRDCDHATIPTIEVFIHPGSENVSRRKEAILVTQYLKLISPPMLARLDCATGQGSEIRRQSGLLVQPEILQCEVEIISTMGFCHKMLPKSSQGV
ncbi:hypothetical protein Tco_1216899 [Tanacetum coccineum]